MLFGEKIKDLRIHRGLTQETIAEKIGVTARSYQNYEAGIKYPKQTYVYKKLMNVFGVDMDYLITIDDQYVIEAKAKGKARAMRDVAKLIKEVDGSLFAGGYLATEDREKVIAALVEQYWEVRQRYKEKYTPKKYRKSPRQAS